MQKAKYWEPTAPQQFEVLLQTCQEATAILGGEADGGIDVDGGFEGLPTGILPYNPCPLPSWEESQSAARADHELQKDQEQMHYLYILHCHHLQDPLPV